VHAVLCWQAHLGLLFPMNVPLTQLAPSDNCVLLPTSCHSMQPSLSGPPASMAGQCLHRLGSVTITPPLGPPTLSSRQLRLLCPASRTNHTLHLYVLLIAVC